MSKIYNKTPLSFQEQISLLKRRGLEIDNEPKAISYLQEISYYRLSAYFFPFLTTKDKFENNITFDQIIKPIHLIENCGYWFLTVLKELKLLLEHNLFTKCHYITTIVIGKTIKIILLRLTIIK